MIKEICIGIIGSLSQHAHIPINVHNIVSQRIERHLQRELGQEVHWNDNSCNSILHYHYSSDKIFVEGEAERFSGHYEASVHQILEEQLPPIQNIVLVPGSTKKEQKNPSKKSKTWAYWTLGGLAGLAMGFGGYYLANKQRKVTNSNPRPSEEKPRNPGGPQPALVW